MSFDLDRFKMGYILLYRNDGSMVGNLIQKYQIKAGIAPEDARYTHSRLAAAAGIASIFAHLRANSLT